MKGLFAALSVFYCLGIILVSLTRVSFWLVLGLGIITITSACLSFRNNRIFTVLVFLSALLVGALSLKNSYMRPKLHISNFVPYNDNTVYSLSGFIDSQPVMEQAGTSFVFRAQEIQANNLKWACCGKVLVKADFPQDLSYADRLTLIGILRRPSGFSSGIRSYRNYLSGQGIYLTMRIKNSLQVKRQGGKSGSKLIIFSLWLRAKLKQVIRRNLPDLPAGILSAMVLGDKNSIPWLVNNYMVKSGTVHILVVSGFNVGIVAFVANLLLKIMRIRKRPRIILTVICLFLYCLITGASNPVMRATVMGTVFLLAYLLQREVDIYSCLACAALFILIVKPGQLFDIGFQLSFSSVLGISCLYPRIKSFLRLGNCRFRALKFVCEGCLVSFCAWLGTMLIIAYNFHIISPVTILANILIVPLATLITLCGFSLVLCGSFSPFLGGIFSTTAAMFINLLLNINAAVIKMPFAYFYF